MLYGNSLSATTVKPDVGYERTLTRTALAATASGQIAGVILWNLALDPAGRPATGAANLAHTGTGRLAFTVQADAATTAGAHADATTTITLDPGSTSCRVVLYHSDDRSTASPAGYHVKQAYVNGTLFWQRDVASEDTAWYTSAPVDVAPSLSGGTGTLDLRLLEQAGVGNYQVNVSFDDLQLTGCSIPNPTFETPAGWSL